MTAHLFTPITLGGLTFANRIAVAPMCQYSADDGSATDWHIQHWMNLAMSGAAMVTLEMTDVQRRGRISHGCHGLYSDHNQAAAKRALDAARRVAGPGVYFGPQLAHAGRKASCQRPWEGGGPLKAHQDPWRTVSASAIPFAEGWHTPRALEEAEIEALIEDFASAARRAKAAGFDFIEVHGAHGYLLNQFVSPLSNTRTDQWGGSLENRLRLPVAVLKAVIAAVPGMMVGARISVSEWAEGGYGPEDGVKYAQALKDAGAAYICCSSGGNAHHQKIPVGAGYQVHLAEAVKNATGVPVRAVGMIDDPAHAERILADGQADMIALGRPFIADPRWPWRAAAALGEPIKVAPQLERGAHLHKRWAKA